VFGYGVRERMGGGWHGTGQALATGRYPRLAELLAPATIEPGPGPEPADRYRDIMARILTGLLIPQPPA
jgi:hypothetical protein